MFNYHFYNKLINPFKSKKPPIPQWRKKDKPLEQGVFYKVKDGEYHRVKVWQIIKPKARLNLWHGFLYPI